MTLVLLVLTLRMRAVLPPEPHHVPRLEVNEEATREYLFSRAVIRDAYNRNPLRQFFRP